MSTLTTRSTEQIQLRIKQLGPWFHNMQLQGVFTAPDHFLGDYPAFKFRNFADAIPADLRGKNGTRYRLQWRILFSGNEAPRRRTRAGY